MNQSRKCNAKLFHFVLLLRKDGFKLLLAKACRSIRHFATKKKQCEGATTIPESIQKLRSGADLQAPFLSTGFDDAIPKVGDERRMSSVRSARKLPLPGAYPQQPDALGSWPLDLVTTSVVKVSALVGWMPTSMSRSVLVMPFLKASA